MLSDNVQRHLAPLLCCCCVQLSNADVDTPGQHMNHSNPNLLTTQTASSAFCTCMQYLSASLYMATVRMPKRRAVRMTLQAISPRFATSSLSIRAPLVLRMLVTFLLLSHCRAGAAGCCSNCCCLCWDAMHGRTDPARHCATCGSDTSACFSSHD